MSREPTASCSRLGLQLRVSCICMPKKYNWATRPYGQQMLMGPKTDNSGEDGRMATFPEEVRKSWTQFIFHANKSRLHPLDWQRFYDFIIASHKLETETTETDVALLLEENGFSEAYATLLSHVYHHGRRILRRW